MATKQKVKGYTVESYVRSVPDKKTFSCDGTSRGGHKTCPSRVKCKATGDTYLDGYIVDRCKLRNHLKDNHCIWYRG